MTFQQTLAGVGYRHIHTMRYGEHLLLEIATGKFEIWACSKNHAGYRLVYGNTHLEFCRSIPPELVPPHWERMANHV